MKRIYDATGIVYLVRVTTWYVQKYFLSMFDKKYDSASAYFVQHQIVNDRIWYNLFFYTIYSLTEKYPKYLVRWKLQ